MGLLLDSFKAILIYNVIWGSGIVLKTPQARLLILNQRFSLIQMLFSHINQ
jgi:hypothetical protein